MDPEEAECDTSSYGLASVMSNDGKVRLLVRKYLSLVGRFQVELLAWRFDIMTYVFQ